MAQSKPGNTARSSSLSAADFAVHFRTKDETVTELYLNESGCSNSSHTAMEKEKDVVVADGIGRVIKETDLQSTESDVKTEKTVPKTESSGSQSDSSSPSEYKKIFWNLNELAEKITKTVEEKLSEIKPGLGSTRTRLHHSRDNSSVSDSEDTSESSRIFDLQSIPEGLSKKSLSFEETPTNDDNCSESAETDVSLLEVENESSSTPATPWSMVKTKVMTENKKDDVDEEEHEELDEEMEVEAAVEAEENTKVSEESDDDPSEYFDARDPLKGAATTLSGAGGRQPTESELVTILRFAKDPENKKIESYALFVIFCIFILPLPSFIRGFCTCLLIFIFWYLAMEYMKFGGDRHRFLPIAPFQIPDYGELRPLEVPRFVESVGVWFNEYTEPYDPDLYSVTHTLPVYLEIEDSFLKLSRPKGKVGKRAICDEKEYKLEFVNQRVYDLKNCRVLLKPDELLRKRFFSKKYPIHITLGPGSLVKSVRFRESGEEEVDVAVTCRIKDRVQGETVYGKDYLNLFARCNRQKEEWFRRLKEACNIQLIRTSRVSESSDSSGLCNRVSINSEISEIDEYWQYMTQFIGEVWFDSKVLKNYLLQAKANRRKRKDFPGLEQIPPEIRRKLLFLARDFKTKGLAPIPEDGEESVAHEKAALEVQWLNALINRMLFDIFRTRYWLEKIKMKVQKKLGSLRLPYYIEALEVIDMDVGKMGPRFHRVSPPMLDDRGLWIDLDMTFDGSFKMTLQTQLNLLKLQKGLEEEASKSPDQKAETRSPQELKSQNEISHSVETETSENPDENVSDKDILAELEKIACAEDSVDNIEAGTSAVNDDDMTDSSESDDYEEEDLDQNEVTGSLNSEESELVGNLPAEQKKPVRRSSKKIFRVMESVAQSKYFKTIAETKYVQKAIAEVSATKLQLILEINGCIGTLTINVPPPPNDRIWYGFRTVPKLWMSAQPKVGHRNIGFFHIKHFVEKKIMEEIKKLIVLPNMDDILLPVPPDGVLVGKIKGMVEPWVSTQNDA